MLNEDGVIFRDRKDAAGQLIPLLAKYRNQHGVVLAVPRGGVPIGYYIARSFNFPLSLVLTKKIGHPINPEFAIGAVSLESEIIEPRGDVSPEYLRREVARIRKTLQERYKKLMGDAKPVDVKNKTVILVDDGIATGNTMIASIRMLRGMQPGKIVVATPVAPPATLKKVRPLADETICLHAPEDFAGVGQFYEDFSEVSDEEVSALLKEANDLANAA